MWVNKASKSIIIHYLDWWGGYGLYTTSCQCHQRHLDHACHLHVQSSSTLPTPQSQPLTHSSLPSHTLTVLPGNTTTLFTHHNWYLNISHNYKTDVGQLISMFSTTAAAWADAYRQNTYFLITLLFINVNYFTLIVAMEFPSHFALPFTPTKDSD